MKKIKIIMRPDPLQEREYMPVDENIQQLVDTMNELITQLNGDLEEER
jgi:flagellar capping protein FliD